MNRVVEFLKEHAKLLVLALVLAGIGLWELLHEIIDGARILTDTIRIDLDDLLGIDLVGLGAVIAGVAALLKVAKNGYVERHHYEHLEERVRLLEEGRQDGLTQEDE